MNHFFKKIVLAVFLLLAVWSCQDEERQESTLNEEANLIANTPLSRLIQRTVMLDGSIDNIIDNANCFLVDLPITVAVNGQTVVVNSTDDYNAIEAILDAATNANNELEIQFPITITLSDYSVVDIENNTELQQYITNCAAANQIDEDIECIDFQYPISIAIFNANFEVIDTEVIDDDEELYMFIDSLNDGLVTSINYPVTMILADGSTLVANNNQELLTAITAAENTCDEDDDNNYNDDDCTLEQANAYLLECMWDLVVTENQMTTNYENVEFNADGNLMAYDSGGQIVLEGNWTLQNTTNGITLNINNSDALITAQWNLSECETERFVFTNGTTQMVMEQDCSVVITTPFQCFENQERTLCDDDPIDGFLTMNLDELFIDSVSCPINFTHSFHTTQADAESNTLPLLSTLYTNVASVETLYLRIQSLDGAFQVYTIQITVEDCCANPDVLIDDLILYMPFANETKDLVSNWQSSNSHTYVTDRAGNSNCAIAFNGSETVSIPVTTSNQIVQGDAFTVSLWFKMQNVDATNYEVLFQKGNTISEGFQISVFDANTPVFSDANSGYGLWDDPWNMDANLPTDTTNWHHLVLTVDLNNTVRLYRDGIQRNSDENSTINIGSSPLLNYVLGNGFEGHLDDIRVYKKALTPNDITTLFTLDADCNVCL